MKGRKNNDKKILASLLAIAVILSVAPSNVVSAKSGDSVRGGNASNVVQLDETESLPADFSLEVSYLDIEIDILKYIEDNNLNIEKDSEKYVNLMYSILYGEISNIDEIKKSYYSTYAGNYISELTVASLVEGGEIPSDAFESTIGDMRESNIEHLNEISEAPPVSSGRFASVYNVAAAQAYATRFATSWNYVFGRYSSDCTNFASQVVYAGGFPMVSGQWQYNSNDYAKNVWNVAADFTEYWSLVRGYNGGVYRTRAQVNSAAKPGDVIAYQSRTDYNIWHCAFVQSKVNDEIYISQHTIDRYNNKWNDIGGASFMNENNVFVINFSR